MRRDGETHLLEVAAPAMTTYGGHKCTEEMGELSQVLGKMGAFPSGMHPDGGPPLVERAEDEIGDVIAALSYFIDVNGLDQERIMARAARKSEQFRLWGLTGLDGRVPPR